MLFLETPRGCEAWIGALRTEGLSAGRATGEDALRAVTYHASIPLVSPGRSDERHAEPPP
jgi:hypothetical protein